MLDIIYNYYVSNEKYEKAQMYDDTLRALKSGQSHIPAFLQEE